MVKILNTLRAVLLDFDGTIVRFEDGHSRAIRSAFFQHFGVETSDDEMRAFTGLPYRMRFEHLLSKYGVDDDFLVEEMLKTARVSFQKDYRPVESVVEGIPEFLEELHRERIYCVVVSSAPHAILERHLCNFSFSHYFNFIIGGDDVEFPKPHPAPYMAALKKLEIKSHEAVAFEDSPPGIESARLAGISVIGITTTFSDEEIAKHTITTIPHYKNLTVAKLQKLLA